MKKIICLIFVAILLMPLSARAEATMGEIWKNTRNSDKSLVVIYYRLGFLNGFIMAKDSLETTTPLLPEKTEKYKASVDFYHNIDKMDIDTTVSAIDSFYADYSNWKVPFNYAVLYVIGRLNGKSEEEYREGLEQTRKLMADKE